MNDPIMPIKKEDIYQPRVLCFMDILGFSEKIEKTRDGKDLKSLRDIANTILGTGGYTERMIPGVQILGHPQFGNFHDVRWCQFSDCVAISMGKVDYDALSWLFHFLQTMSYIVLEYDMLLRGGIVYGDLFHENHKIFGPAMLEAYRLENEHAFYPRIVLSHSMMELVDATKQYGLTIGASLTDMYLEFDPDFPYIDYICKNYRVERDFQHLNELRKRLALVVKEYEHHQKASVRAKYAWIAEKIPRLDVIIEATREKIDATKAQIQATP